MNNTERIEALRKNAIEQNINFHDFYILFYKKLAEISGRANDYSDYAQAYLFAAENVTVNIDAFELVVGKPRNTALSASEQNEWESLSPYFDGVYGAGQDSHMAIDYELLLKRGCKSLQEEMAEKARNESIPEKKAFYNCVCEVLKAACILAKRYADKALELAEKENDAGRKAELYKISEICRRVPQYPASSFYEAVQAVSFITYLISSDPHRHANHQQYQLGRPDRYLIEYYSRDIENKVITRDFAKLLVNCLSIQINNRVPHGLSSGYMVGGYDENGRLVENELTKIFLETIDEVRLVYPAVGLCYTPDTSDDILRLSCEILSHGRSHPAIFNDTLISEGLRDYGVSEKDSHNYIQSTCVEITPIAGSDVWVASPYINLAQILIDVMDREYSDFEQLREAYFKRLWEITEYNAEEQNMLRRKRAEMNFHPLVSCFVNDCLSCGRDIECGGARYNWIMPSFVGVSNVADSFAAIYELVFNRKRLTLREYKKMIDRNFRGYKDIYNVIMNDITKYGNDNDAVDEFVNLITRKIIEGCKKAESKEGRLPLVPSVFCWIMHTILGSQTQATPDGRLAKFPLGDGSGPAQGRELLGPTASILSSTKWSHKEFIGGVAVNMKFSKKIFSEDSVSNIMQLIKTFIARGGFEMQINVTDKKTLEAALEHPELYRDLLVRIGGYSDYFVTLSSEMQQELILRTEHEI